MKKPDAGRRYLIKTHVLEILLVTMLVAVLDFVPMLLVCFLANATPLYWLLTAIWIFAVQLGYYTYLTVKGLKQSLKKYEELMQIVYDTLDVINTEKSFEKEKEVGPN